MSTDRTTTTVEIVRKRLADGRTISDMDVHRLVAEIDKLEARVAGLDEELFEARNEAVGLRMRIEDAS